MNSKRIIAQDKMQVSSRLGENHPIPRLADGDGLNRYNSLILKELDTVVLVHDLDEKGLKQGDVGAVAHCYLDGAAYEVEFVTAEGRTIALVTLTTADIRPMKDSEVLHVREFTSA